MFLSAISEARGGPSVLSARRRSQPRGSGQLHQSRPRVYGDSPRTADDRRADFI